MNDNADLIQLTARIVASFVSGNCLPISDLPDLISSTHSALLKLREATAQRNQQLPAVPVEDSVQDQYLVCLEDGRKLKSLKNYLQRHFRMTPEDYRAKWSLPPDYPMVAPGYSALRSSIAKRQAGSGGKSRGD